MFVWIAAILPFIIFNLRKCSKNKINYFSLVQLVVLLFARKYHTIIGIYFVQKRLKRQLFWRKWIWRAEKRC